jgi:GNAT superfamily N-acetyltransferase
MPEKWEFTKYRPNRRDEVLALQRHLWGDDLSTNSRYLAWKYENNPYIAEPLIYLALHNDRVVGMRGVFGSNWKIGSEQLRAAGVGDLVVHPDYTNEGLLRKIMECALEDLACKGYVYLVSLSASPVTYLRSLRMGWELAAPFNTRLRPGLFSAISDRARALLKRIPVFWRYADKTLLPRFYVFDRGAKLRRFDFPIAIEREPRPEEMATLVERVCEGKRIRHARDVAYFRWRFRNPRSEYRFLFYLDPELQGYLVLQARPGGHEINIMDWEACDAEIGDCLLRAAVRSARGSALKIWSATARQNMLLEKSGFAELNETRGIELYRPGALIKRIGKSTKETEDTERILLDPGSWDLRMLYSDMY